MSVYKVIQVNDVHVSDQPPRMRNEGYLDQIIAKLGFTMDLARELEVDRVVITGDLFHRQNAAHTSHRTVQRVRNILWDARIPVSLVPGNHDHARGGGIEGQPIVSVVGDNIEWLFTGEEWHAPIAGIEWSNEFEREPYAFVRAVREANAPLIFAHAPLSPTPYPFGPEAQGWIHIEAIADELPRSVRLIAHGHMHKGHVPLTYNGIKFSNPGALSRATIAEDDFNRVPQVALIEYEDGEVQVTYHPIAHRPAEEVFLTAQRAREVERSEAAERLVAALDEAHMVGVTPDVLIEHLRALKRPDEERTVEAWDAGLEKAVLSVMEASK